MASFGILALSPAGELLINQDRLGWALIDSWVIAAGSDVTHSYPDFSGYDLKAYSIKLGNGGGHMLTISGTDVTATNTPYPGMYIETESDSVVSVYVR